MEEEFNDQQKDTHGAFAGIIWLIGSVLLFLFDARSPGLISLQALGFIVVGMFVSAVVVGNITYWMQKKLASALANNLSSDIADLDDTIIKVERYAKLLFVLDFFIAIIFLYWVYNSFFLMGD